MVCGMASPGKDSIIIIIINNIEKNRVRYTIKLVRSRSPTSHINTTLLLIRVSALGQRDS